MVNNKENKSSPLSYLFLCCIGILVIPFIASCGKGNNNLPTGSNIQLQVVNLSPDLLPVNVWINFIRRNVPYSYPSPSGYFSVTTTEPPIQIRSASALVSTTPFITLTDTLRPNVKYTIFVAGLRRDTIKAIFTIDTASASTVGRGKVRFVNASPGSGKLDVLANGTPAFTNQDYLTQSKFVEIPPGNYDFKIIPSGSTGTELTTVRAVPVLDGKLYTIYCYGLVGGVDSVRFGGGVIANK